MSTSTVSLAPAMSSRLPMSAAASEHDDALADSTAWISALRHPAERDGAIARLHELLLRAARFEVSRRRAALSTCAARSSTIWRCRPPTMRSSRCSQARRLPRGQPLHHLGLQVRPARGRRAAAPAGLAGARGGARAGGLAADGRRGQGRAVEPRRRADARDHGLDRRLPDGPPARGSRCARTERRAARRAGRPAEHDARRALQDTSRRPAEATCRPGEEGLYARLD